MVNTNAIQLLNNCYLNFDAAANTRNAAFNNNVQRYLELKHLLHQTNVSHDVYFQRRYSDFYALNQARLGQDRKAVYFQTLERLKNGNQTITVPGLTELLEPSLGKYHFSFCSKMANLINDSIFPIYDKNVKRHFHRQGLGFGHDYYNSIYIDITDTYRALENNPIIIAFQNRYNAHDMGYMKVLDALFWAM